MTKSAYDEGFQARLRGEQPIGNPYPKGTADRIRWESGWTDQDHHLNQRDDALDSIGWFGRPSR